MKKAFTMIEIVFVIIIIGIITAIAIPKLNNDNLQTAADQVISHIRYTQHLAMQDDKFNLSDTQWFKGRWQFMVSGANSSLSYIVFSDTKSKFSNKYEQNPNGSSSRSEVAIDPENHSIYLIGTTYSSFFTDSKKVINPKLNLKDTYGIQSIKFSGGNSGSSQKRIVFDNIGRPYRGYKTAASATNPYSDMYLLKSKLIISLCTEKPCPSGKSDNKIDIAIEPETGYVHIEK